MGPTAQGLTVKIISFDASMGPTAQGRAVKIQVASVTIAEEDRKEYSANRLANIIVNLHIEEFDNKNAHSEEAFFRSSTSAMRRIGRRSSA